MYSRLIVVNMDYFFNMDYGQLINKTPIKKKNVKIISKSPPLKSTNQTSPRIRTPLQPGQSQIRFQLATERSPSIKRVNDCLEQKKVPYRWHFFGSFVTRPTRVASDVAAISSNNTPGPRHPAAAVPMHVESRESLCVAHPGVLSSETMIS